MTKPATAKRRAEAPANDHDLLKRVLKESHQPEESARSARTTQGGPGVVFEQLSEIKLSTATNYLVKGLIDRGAMSVWFGPPGSGKSFALLHIAHAVATGRETVFTRKVKQAKVALFVLEGQGNFDKRAAAIQMEYGKTDSIFIHRRRLALLKNEALVDEVIENVKANGIGLVVIDTLSRAMPGGDENSHEAMSSIVDAFSRIIDETGAHVAIIHHPKKSQDGKQVLSSRGHSSLLGGIDVEVCFEDTVDRTRVGTVLKARDGKDNWSFAYKLKTLLLGQDDDGDMMDSQVVIETALPTKATKQKPPSDRVQVLLGLIGEMKGENGNVRRDELMKNALARGLWGNDEAVRGAIRRGVSEKRIATDRTFVWAVDEAM